MRPIPVLSYQRLGIRPLGGPSPMRLRLMLEKWFGEVVWAWAEPLARVREAQKRDMSTLVTAGASGSTALHVMALVHISRWKRSRQNWNEHPAHVLKRVRGRRRPGRVDMIFGELGA